MPIDADYNRTLPPLRFTFRRWRGKYLWAVEARDASGLLSFPVGTAWVSDYPIVTQVEYVLVADQYRRQGVAGRLLAAVRERWPRVVLTAAISSEGRALRASTNRYPMAKPVRKVRR